MAHYCFPSLPLLLSRNIEGWAGVRAWKYTVLTFCVVFRRPMFRLHAAAIAADVGQLIDSILSQAAGLSDYEHTPSEAETDEAVDHRGYDYAEPACVASPFSLLPRCLWRWLPSCVPAYLARFCPCHLRLANCATAYLASSSC